MPHHEAVPSGRDRFAGLGYETLVPLALMVLCQVLLTTASGGTAFGELKDPDAYMRLVRVLGLEGGAPWFDPRVDRIMPPDGHVQHWTRPVDALLWLGGKLLQPIVGFERGLLVWGTLFSPTSLALTILAMNWAVAPLLGRDGRFIACLLLPVQPWVLGYATLGRPDHHSLLLLLFVLMLGIVARVKDVERQDRWAVLGGVVAGTALWISVEALTFVGAAMVVLGLRWLAGAPGERSRSFAAAAAATALVAVLIERGGHDPLAAEADRMSVVHVTLLALIALFWSVVQRLPLDGPGAMSRRAVAGAVGAAGVVATMAVLFPDLRHGILGVIDPVYRELRLQRILEVQPLIDPARLARGEGGSVIGRAILAVGLTLVAVPVLVHYMVTGGPDDRWRWLPVAVALAIYLPLTFYQIRWGMYLQAALVIPYASAVVAAANRLARVMRAQLQAIVRPFVVTGALIWPHAAAQAFPGAERTESADKSCPIATLAPVLVSLAERPMTIMALADLGPEILYRTPHAVLSIPNHRPQPGFGLTASILGGEAEEAEPRLREAGVDWILICGSHGEAAFFGAAEGASGSLYDRLMSDEPPDWLHRISFPATPEARLFALGDAGRWPRAP